MVGCTSRVHHWGWHQGKTYIWSFLFIAEFFYCYYFTYNNLAQMFHLNSQQTQHLSVSLASTTLHVTDTKHTRIIALLNCSNIQGIKQTCSDASDMCHCRSALRQRRKPLIRWSILVLNWLDRWNTTLFYVSICNLLSDRMKSITECKDSSLLLLCIYYFTIFIIYHSQNR